MNEKGQNPLNPSNNPSNLTQNQTDKIAMSQEQIKNASKQIGAHKGGESSEPKQSKPKNKKNDTGQDNGKKRKKLFLIVLICILLLPMPKQVGGDVEISGAPSINQALIRPTVNGTLEKFIAKTNEKVSKGEAIAILRNWEIEEKILEGEKQVARLGSSLGPLSAQVQVAQEEYDRAYAEFLRQQSESQFIQKQFSMLRTKQDPPKIKASRKELEQTKLQAESLSQKAALHKYLSDQGVYPRQSALQTAYEAASAVKQVESMEAQLDSQEAELTQRALEDVPRLYEVKKSANANFQRLEATRRELEANQSQLEEAERQLEIYKREREALTLRSPIDGVVLTLKTEMLVGQNFNKGDIVATVANTQKASASLQLPEEDRTFVKNGQRITFRIRAVNDRVFEGTVEKIAPITSETGDESNRRRIWEITSTINNPQGDLRPGMTGYARVHTGHWNPFIFLAWDEVYKAFRLDRYMDRNPISSFLNRE
ncbi:MAG TPA: efflux RND transporter periplasmic adaptor subunit [Vampirovibrionales bacterium]